MVWTKEERKKYNENFRAENPNYHKEYYQKNKEKIKNAVKLYQIKKYGSVREARRIKRKIEKEKNKKFIENYKKDKFCVKCGYKKYPQILHFHHLRGKYKELSRMERNSRKKIMEEINKCEVLCPNCHTEEHLKTPED